MNNQPYDKLSDIFNKPQSAAAISLLLVLYTGIAAPQLPKNIANIFGNSFFRMIMFLLILYISQYNFNIALIATIGLVTSIQTYNSYKINNKMMITLENYELEHTQAQNEINFIQQKSEQQNQQNEQNKYLQNYINEFAELQKETENIDNVTEHETVSNAQTEIENLSIDSTFANKSVLRDSELTNQNNKIINPNVNGYNNDDTFAYV